MGDRVYTGMTPADALKMMLYPSHGRTTRSVEYWAGQVGKSPSMVYAQCNGDREITLTDATLYTNITGDSLLIDAFCLTVNHMAFSIKQPDLPSTMPVMEQIIDAAQQQAEAIKCACEAIKDGVATPDERTALDKEIVEMMGATSRMREMVWQLPARRAKPENVQQLKRDCM